MTIPQLADQAAAEALIASAQPAWILKHSNACPVSFAALEQVQAHLAAQPAAAGMVVVQTARPLSNWLATRLGFVHQSPQLFLLAGGQVRWQASHWGITAPAMATALAQAKG